MSISTPMKQQFDHFSDYKLYWIDHVCLIYIKLLSAIDLLFSLFVRDESWTTIPVYKTAILHEIKITCSMGSFTNVRM